MVICLLFRFGLCCNLWGHFLNVFNYSEQFFFGWLVLFLLLLLLEANLYKSKFLGMLDGTEEFLLGDFVLALLWSLCNLGKALSVILDFS